MQTSRSLRNIHEILNEKKIIKQQTTLFPTQIQYQSYPWIIILRFASFLLRKYIRIPVPHIRLTSCSLHVVEVEVKSETKLVINIYLLNAPVVLHIKLSKLESSDMTHLIYVMI